VTPPPAATPYDLAILGATPAGIFAALAAARRDRRAILVTPTATATSAASSVTASGKDRR
jgi:thioredoxin reductase